MEGVMVLILAGGRGERLGPLTKECSKPAVPFGGKWLIFDFVMDSVLNSEANNTLIFTQYCAQPLINHVDEFGYSSPLHGKSVRVVPAQQRAGSDWYQGTADAVFQNMQMILDDPIIDTVAILAGDHIYKIDLRQVCDFHRAKKSVFTVCTMVCPVSEAEGRFGVLQIDGDFRVVGFEEKPEHPKEIPGMPGFCMVSMGNYFADAQFLAKVLGEDSTDGNSSHDFGKDIIPEIIRSGREVFAYDFSKNKIRGERGPYWRDVGTIGSYHDAHMDLVIPEPKLNLYNRHWPMHTLPDNLPPAKSVHTVLSRSAIASGGCILDGSNDPGVLRGMIERNEAHAEMSVFGRSVRVGLNSRIERSIIFTGARIGPGVKLGGVIVESGVVIPAEISIGYNHDEDEARGLTVQDGVTIVPKRFVFGQK